MSFWFGDFELDQERRQLLRSGEPVPLEPKAYELLSLLLERRPRALSKAQIRDVVWPGVFVTDTALGVEVNAIRQALGDDARHPRFIRTIHGFGYAFFGEVRDDASGRTSAGSDHRPVLLWGALGALTVAVALGGWLVSRRAAHAPAGPLAIRPFTTDGGFKQWPQLSPDGDKVAYSWAGPDGDNWDIYVKAEGVGTRPLRLTEHPADEWSPVWSPDGRRIAFVRALDTGAAIYAVPSLGGQERRLMNVSGALLPALSWSPDGRWLAFAEKASESQPAHIVRLSLQALERQRLTSPPEDSAGDSHPAVSPDGTLLAFVRSGAGQGTAGNLDVWIQPIEGGQPWRLTNGSYDFCHSLAWTPDGNAIVFTASVAERIFRVSLAGGDPQPVPGPGEHAGSASVRANRMVYAQTTASPWSIWRVPGQASRRGGVPERLIASSQWDIAPAWSPDGRRIAFESARSGAQNVWVCDADGSHPVQLTSFPSYTGTPRWSPDGQRIVFDSVEAGDWNLYVIDADGGTPRRLTPEPSDEYRGVWSRDGRWIYFGSNRGQRLRIWRIPAEGGQAIQVTQRSAVHAEMSWDGRHLYFVSPENGIWRMLLAGGEETEVLRGQISYHSDWTLSRSGIYYATQRGREFTIRVVGVETGEVRELFRKEGPFSHHWVAVSPDEQWILYGEQPFLQSELMLVENFR